jgi:hypothetical protein
MGEWDWIAERERRVERARGPFDTLCRLGMMSVDTSVGRDGRLPVYAHVDQVLRDARNWCYEQRRPHLIAEQAPLATWAAVQRLVHELVFASTVGWKDPATVAWAMARIQCAGPAAAVRVRQAWEAVREWRAANQQRDRIEDEICLAIRWTAEVVAGDLAAHAGAGQDPAVVAWIVAGLRCGRRPFCRGCESCFTIDAPHRVDVDLAALPGRIPR